MLKADADRVSQSVGARVAETLSRAESEADRILASAEERAARAGAQDVSDLRGRLTERIDQLRTMRSQLDAQGRRTRARLNELAAEFTRVSSTIAPKIEAMTSGSGFEQALAARAEGKTRGGDNHGPPHLAAVVTAAEASAAQIVNEARGRGREVAAVASREAENIASEAPRSLARVYDPIAHDGEAVRARLTELAELFGSPDVEQDAEQPEGT